MAGTEIKNLIARFFALFGFGIYKTRKNGKSQTKPEVNVTWKDFKIESPLSHNTRERMNDFFSDEKMLAQYLGEERINFYNEITELAKTLNITCDGKDILDAGCGTGHLLKIFTKNTNPKSITGWDFSEEALKVALNTFPKGNFYLHDIYTRIEKKYDLILCTEVIEHLLDPELAVENLISTLNESSHLLITVPNGRMDFYEGHINFWSPESWDMFFKKKFPDYRVKTGVLSQKKNNFAVIQN